MKPKVRGCLVVAHNNSIVVLVFPSRVLNTKFSFRCITSLNTRSPSRENRFPDNLCFSAINCIQRKMPYGQAVDGSSSPLLHQTSSLKFLESRICVEFLTVSHSLIHDITRMLHMMTPSSLEKETVVRTRVWQSSHAPP